MHFVFKINLENTEKMDSIVHKAEFMHVNGHVVVNEQAGRYL